MIRFSSSILFVLATFIYAHLSNAEVPNIVLPVVELELDSIERSEWTISEDRKTVPSIKFKIKETSSRDLRADMNLFNCREIWPSTPVNNESYANIARDYGSARIQYGTVWAVFSNVRPVELPGNPYGPKGLKRGLCFYDKVSFKGVRLGYVSEIDTSSASLQSITIRNTFVRRAFYRSPDNRETRSLEFAFQPAGKFFWISDEDKSKGLAACERIVLSRQVSAEEINDAIFARDITYEFQNIRYSNIDNVCLADDVKRANSDEEKYEMEFLRSDQIIGDIEGTIKLASGIGVVLESDTVANDRFTTECLSSSANRRWNEGNEIKARLKNGMRVRLTSVRLDEGRRCDFARLIVLPPNQSERADGQKLGDVAGRAISFSEYGYILQEPIRYASAPSNTPKDFTDFEQKCRSVVFPLDGELMEKSIAEWQSVVAKNVLYIGGRCYVEEFQFSQASNASDLYDHPEWLSVASLASLSANHSSNKKILTEKARSIVSRPPVATTAEGFIFEYSPTANLKNLLILKPYLQEPIDSQGRVISCKSFQYMPSDGSTGMTTQRLEHYAYWFDLSFKKIAVRLLGVKSGTDKNPRCTFSKAVAINESGKEIPRPSTFFDRSIIDKPGLTKWYDSCLQENLTRFAHIGLLEYCTCRATKMSDDAVKTVGQPLASIVTPSKKHNEISKLIHMSDYYCQNPDHYKITASGSTKIGVGGVKTSNADSVAKPQRGQYSNSENIGNAAKPFVLLEFGHFKVVPKDPNAPIAPDIKALWAKGFYVHLKEDGTFGFNTDDPGPYLYLPVNRWKNGNGIFTLTLDKVVYAFTLPNKESSGETTLTTVDSSLNAFKMTYVTKEKDAR